MPKLLSGHIKMDTTMFWNLEVYLSGRILKLNGTMANMKSRKQPMVLKRLKFMVKIKYLNNANTPF